MARTMRTKHRPLGTTVGPNVTRGPGESRNNKFSSREVEFLGFFPLSPSFFTQHLNHETSS